MRRSAGMTLIEIMVTLAVVALILGVTVNRMSDSFDSRAFEATERLASTIRYLYNKSASENLTMRMVFDFEKRAYHVEATADQFLIDNPEARDRLSVESKPSELSAEKPKEGEVTPIQKAEAKFGEVDSYLLKPVELPGGVFLKDIFTEHDSGAVDQGKAYIYIFPSGYVEHAIINLRNEDDSARRALEINPMTGNSKAYDDYRTPKK
jgi:prepilin-type N-terminal cleavage/methylation domain-containing protein